MILTGTTDRERIESAIAFAKAHRTHEYNHDLVAKIYQSAGVPLTEAAERFCREWDGVFDCVFIYPCRPNVSSDDGNHYLVDIDFTFYLLASSDWEDNPGDELRYWYDPDYAESQQDWYEWCSKHIREKYGADTVPVAKGGYYYPDIIWIRPDGQLISNLPDNGSPHREKVYDSLHDFIYDHLSGHGASRIEVLLERQALEGTMEARIDTAIAFAKDHGGFANCRLFAEVYNRAPLDISRITERENLSDAETAALIHQVLVENTPKWRDETTLPCEIWFVDA